MEAEYLIIGQGICGTMLSWFLHKEGKTVLVMDDGNLSSSSKVAAGIMNPVTGRRYAYTWMLDEVIPFAVQTYRSLGDYFDTSFVFERSVIEFFPSPQMRQSFIERLTRNDTYLHSYPNQNYFNQYFNYDFGCGEIRPAYTVDLSSLMSAWRQKLETEQRLLQQKFAAADLRFTDDGFVYQNISVQKIIFCDGVKGANTPWFELLPFALNKGEALVIECEDLDRRHIFKKSFLLAPLAIENQYWVGSNYEWEFEDDQPTEGFFKQATTALNGWLKQPYKVISHKAAVRPATVERRPFVGFHPVYPNLGILNGMGTKGTSLAPFFANQLVQHLVHGLPLAPEADIHRFTRILSK